MTIKYSQPFLERAEQIRENGHLSIEEQLKRAKGIKWAKVSNKPKRPNNGLAFEKAINDINELYLEKNIAVIHKRPTPITVQKVEKGKITEAFFDDKSTTDYVGFWNGK